MAATSFPPCVRSRRAEPLLPGRRAQDVPASHTTTRAATTAGPSSMIDVVNHVWKLHGDGRTVGAGEAVGPDERLRLPRMLGLGAQHVLAMSSRCSAPRRSFRC